jgi:hypothetical protein
MGGGVGEAMLIGAAMGGGSAAMTGGDPLKGALFGAAGGGFGAGIAGAQAGGAAGASGGASGSAAGGASGAAGSATALPSALQQAHMGPSSLISSAGQATGQAGIQAASNPMFPKIAEFAAKNPMAYRAGMGALGATVGGALTPEMPGMPKHQVRRAVEQVCLRSPQVQAPDGQWWPGRHSGCSAHDAWWAPGFLLRRWPLTQRTG